MNARKRGTVVKSVKDINEATGRAKLCKFQIYINSRLKSIMFHHGCVDRKETLEHFVALQRLIDDLEVFLKGE